PATPTTSPLSLTRRSSDLIQQVDAFPVANEAPQRRVRRPESLAMQGAEGAQGLADQALLGLRQGSLAGQVLPDRVQPLHVIVGRSEEHTSELQSRENLVCR